jgi:hypothetical protein
MAEQQEQLARARQVMQELAALLEDLDDEEWHGGVNAARSVFCVFLFFLSRNRACPTFSQ